MFVPTIMGLTVFALPIVFAIMLYRRWSASLTPEERKEEDEFP